MKLRITLATVLVLGVLATSVCRKPETNTAQLEELPKDIAANLHRVPNSDLLVAMPPVAIKTPAALTPETPAAGLPPPPVPPCQSTERLLVQVDYPVTICSPRPNVLEVLANYDAVMGQAPKPANTVKSFKLSFFEGKGLTNAFSCTQRSGPWLATIFKRLDCSLNGSCVMVIEGIPPCPNCPTFIWYGQSCESQGRPPEVQFIDPLISAGIFRSPCNSKNMCQ